MYMVACSDSEVLHQVPREEFKEIWYFSDLYSNIRVRAVAINFRDKMIELRHKQKAQNTDAQ